MIYFLSYSPQQSVQWLCDQHIKEANWHDIWKLNWIKESRVNWEWAKDYIEAIAEEHIFRFRTPHQWDSAFTRVDNFVIETKDLNYMTPINCDIIPESCVDIDSINTYRNWYSRIVGPTHKWTNRQAPIWIKEQAAIAA